MKTSNLDWYGKGQDVYFDQLFQHVTGDEQQCFRDQQNSPVLLLLISGSAT